MSGSPEDAISRLVQGQEVFRPPAPRQAEVEEAQEPERVVSTEEVLAHAADHPPGLVIAAMKAGEIPRVVCMGHGWAVVFLVDEPNKLEKLILETRV